MIICDSDKAEALQKKIIKKILEEYHLEIQEKKVELTEFRANSKGQLRAFNKKKEIKEDIIATTPINEKRFYKSLQYLGFEYNGQSIFIRSSSLSRYFRKMKGRIIKTIVMAYSNKGSGDNVWKKQIFERYSHLGERNFLTYAYNASQEFYENRNKEKKQGMNSPSIRKQLSRHFTILQHTLNSKNYQRFEEKAYKGKAKKIKAT